MVAIRSTKTVAKRTLLSSLKVMFFEKTINRETKSRASSYITTVIEILWNFPKFILKRVCHIFKSSTMRLL